MAGGAGLGTVGEVGDEAMRIEGSTPEILLLYFGLEQGRSIRKKDLQNELVLRGVSVVMTEEAIRGVLTQIGYAADNRIPEIDAQLDP